MTSGYLQEQLGGGKVRFTVTPAPVPRATGAPLGAAALFATIVLGPLPTRMGAVMILFRLVVAAWGGWCAHHLTGRWLVGRVDRMRSPGGTFVASPAGIEVADGTSLERDRLHRLIIRNGLPGAASPAPVEGEAATARALARGPAERSARRAGAASVCYMVCAESGGGSTTLAGGMTEVTARGLLIDVSRILRLG